MYCKRCGSDGHYVGDCQRVVEQTIKVTVKPVTIASHAVTPASNDHRNDVKHCPTCSCSTRKYKSKAEKQAAYRKRKAKADER